MTSAFRPRSREGINTRPRFRPPRTAFCYGRASEPRRRGSPVSCVFTEEVAPSSDNPSAAQLSRLVGHGTAGHPCRRGHPGAGSGFGQRSRRSWEAPLEPGCFPPAQGHARPAGLPLTGTTALRLLRRGPLSYPLPPPLPQEAGQVSRSALGLPV